MMEFNRRSSAQCIHLSVLFKLQQIHPYIRGLSQKNIFWVLYF